MTVLFATLTGVCAQVRVPLPFTPVPFTLQTAAVILSGIVLGPSAWTAQVLYLFAGLGGTPWFSGQTAGFPPATIGYIIGFVPAAFIAGWASRQAAFRTSIAFRFGMLSIAAFSVYLPGCLWLSSFLSLPLSRSFLIGALPFMPGDLLKVGLLSMVLRKQN